MFKILTFFMLMLMMYNSHALTISWVGDSSTCDNTTNTHNNLIGALFAALLNDDDDEIRLTAQASYLGDSNGRYVLTDWNPSTTGSLLLKGGYFDCGSSQSGRTIIGDTSGSIFNISTSSQPISSVSLENIEIRNGDIGLEISGGAEVTLSNTVIKNHKQGVRVTGGAFLDVSADSTIELNDDYNNFNSHGGGIHCSGTNSLVTFKGTLSKNRANSGGNLYVNDNCFVELENGSELIGANNTNVPDAASGGGILVENFGELFATGNQNLVIIKDHTTTSRGGAILVLDDGRVTLLNTHLVNNYAGSNGSAISLQNAELYMDRVENCPFLISCSKISQNSFDESVIKNVRSTLEISRTIIDQNTSDPEFKFQDGVINNANPESVTRLDRVGIYNNQAKTALSVESGTMSVTHSTIARNNTGAFPSRSTIVDRGQLIIENSILTDSSGAEITEPSGSITGKCNMVNIPGEMPANSYFVGTAVFNDSGGDLRQRSDSDSVDACFEDNFVWSNNLDIENQSLPVNESTNPNGFPGETGGLYDAGFDEALINVGPDDVIFINGFD